MAITWASSVDSTGKLLTVVATTDAGNWGTIATPSAGQLSGSTLIVDAGTGIGIYHNDGEYQVSFSPSSVQSVSGNGTAAATIVLNLPQIVPHTVVYSGATNAINRLTVTLPVGFASDGTLSSGALAAGACTNSSTADEVSANLTRPNINERLAASIKLGVAAFAYGASSDPGIASVAAYNNSGGALYATATTPSANPNAGNYPDYNFTLNPANFADGPVTLRIVVTPNGTSYAPRTLYYTFYANSGGTLPGGGSYWVDSTSSIAGTTSSGPFTDRETVTQATSGATATVILSQTTSISLRVSTIVGSPDNSHVWSGATASFTPSGSPVANGSDTTGNGTQGNPYATISKVSTALVDGTTRRAITAYCNDGDYAPFVSGDTNETFIVTRSPTSTSRSTVQMAVGAATGSNLTSLHRGIFRDVTLSQSTSAAGQALFPMWFASGYTMYQWFDQCSLQLRGAGPTFLQFFSNVNFANCSDFWTDCTFINNNCPTSTTTMLVRGCNVIAANNDLWSRSRMVLNCTTGTLVFTAGNHPDAYQLFHSGTTRDQQAENIIIDGVQTYAADSQGLFLDNPGGDTFMHNSIVRNFIFQKTGASSQVSQVQIKLRNIHIRECTFDQAFSWSGTNATSSVNASVKNSYFFSMNVSGVTIGAIQAAVTIDVNQYETAAGGSSVTPGTTTLVGTATFRNRSGNDYTPLSGYLSYATARDFDINGAARGVTDAVGAINHPVSGGVVIGNYGIDIGIGIGL